MAQPAHKTKPHRRATVEQLRRDIDRGATHDKVPGSDPAAAPLGTDEEAAGTPPLADAVAIDRERELRTRAGRPSAPAEGPPGKHLYWLWLAVPGAAAVLVAAILLLRHT